MIVQTTVNAWILWFAAMPSKQVAVQYVFRSQAVADDVFA
jgi:hypothetical protein